ncbi:DASS family sodium-coupled anion symporter [Halorubrum sp. SD683]|uniref:SLC13 family permease n=1 Tax=Halorubrum sp. SD683 TaxID=1855873 RepID=UPI000A2E2FE6|nr:DASS family sodium-coupled anion symporter [Halorubrum sp. SD683]OTF01784.1 anion transporter [Halorubrum sp. SD683]
MSHATRLATIAAAVVATAAIAVAPTAGQLTTAGQYAVATMAFAAILWITGALPLALTALTIPILLTVFGVYPEFETAVLGFADPVIFLLLSGFMFAEALQTHGIDRRIALAILVRFGSSVRGLVLGVMVATALLSMVVSNTATVAMMVPIVLGIVESVTDLTKAGEEPRGSPGASNLQIAMLLGVAYAASLGGVGTLIGTPPNAIVVGQLDDLIGVEITFVEWLAVGLPMVVVTLPVAWVLLTYVVYPPREHDVERARERARERLRETGTLSSAARRTVAVFGTVAALWLLGGLGFLFEGVLPGSWYVTLFGGAAESVFGTAGHEGLLFYVLVGLLGIPALVVSGGAAWDDLLDIDWGTLLLLGGGISLANALHDTAATVWLAELILGPLAGAPIIAVLLVVIAMTVVVGEIASNTAMAAVLVPILVNIGPAYAAALGTTGELASVLLAVTGAVAASYGFALPVATPPNAIVFGAGYVEREHMLRAGVLLDVVVILLTTGMAYLLVRLLWPVVLS